MGEGGLIITASRCEDGFPDHGNFRKMLLEYPTPEAMLEAINSPGFSTYDQWQVQLFAQILQKSTVALHSDIDPEAVRRVHLEPVANITTRISEELERIGQDAPTAVLPEGPMTVPYLEHAPVRA